jgi:hypothetical protein
VEYENCDNQRRVWPALTAPNGKTLQLDPGESVDLDLAADFEDPYLVPREPVVPKRESFATGGVVTDPVPVMSAESGPETLAQEPPINQEGQQS